MRNGATERASPVKMCFRLESVVLVRLTFTQPYYGGVVEFVRKLWDVKVKCVCWWVFAVCVNIAEIVQTQLVL